MSLPAAVRPVFRAAAEALLPAAGLLDEVAWAEVERIVDHALAQRQPKARRQVALFLRVLDVYPLLRHRRRFRALPVETRARVLHDLERARHVLLRRGVWGIRTLVFMGYYTQPVHSAQIGYHASARGWRAVSANAHGGGPATGPRADTSGPGRGPRADASGPATGPRADTSGPGNP